MSRPVSCTVMPIDVLLGLSDFSCSFEHFVDDVLGVHAFEDLECDLSTDILRYAYQRFV